MEKCDPFLKWPGGKRWIIPFLKEIIDIKTVNNYYEPFLGGGAVFFSFNFPNAILSDKNEQLINSYKVVKENPDYLIEELKKLPSNRETYYKIRNTIYTNKFDEAVQFIYLNRLSFGGMYRVNQQGKFNVPFGGDGRSTNLLWTKNIIKNASQKLNDIELNCHDFQATLKKAQKGDLVYCDPPYTVCHNLNGFQRYNEKIFEWKDQIRLAQECKKASKKGVKIVVSNAAHESIKELYYPIEPKIVERFSGLSKNSKLRKNIDEYLFLINTK